MNEDFFDTIAPIYDQRTSGDWTSPSVVAAKAKPLLGTETSLLDFGVGTGRVLAALNVSKNHSNIFAVDVASGMITETRKKFPAADIRQITTACDIRTFGWPQFDLILSSGVFEYIERIDTLLCDLSALLSEDGEIIFTYQPIIMHHPTQFSRTTNICWTANVAQSTELTIKKDIEAIEFRLHTHCIDEFCVSAGLQIIEYESFVAYYDLCPEGNKIPKIYNIVRAKTMTK